MSFVATAQIPAKKLPDENKTSPDKHLVSIITPAYNSQQFIEETISSVQSQTYPNWEMLIIDDCSEDNTPEVLARIARSDQRIIWKRHDKNTGIALSRNDALKMANGRFIAFLDHDDVWLPRKLERQIGFMLEHNYHFTYTAYDRISEDGRFVNHIPAPEQITYHDFLKNTIIGCLTVVIDRQYFAELSFEPILSNDLALWIKLLKFGNAHGIQENHAKYRIVKGSASQNKIKTAGSLWFIYRKIEKLSLIYSIYCLFFWALNAAVKRLHSTKPYLLIL